MSDRSLELVEVCTCRRLRLGLGIGSTVRSRDLIERLVTPPRRKIADVVFGTPGLHVWDFVPEIRKQDIGDWR